VAEASSSISIEEKRVEEHELKPTDLGAILVQVIQPPRFATGDERAKLNAIIGRDKS
jgi:hypothetical protein